VQAPGFDPATEVVLEGGEALDLNPPTRATIDFDALRLNELQLRVDMPADGYLVLSEVWYPGWQAWVDGEAAPVLRANYAFRAVRLTPGQHQVRLTFAPRSWLVGLVVTLATLAVVAVSAGAHVLRRRREPVS